jgi:hypothetical protein
VKIHLKELSVAAAILCCTIQPASPARSLTSDDEVSPRERLLMDFDWRFAFGHATDPARDFDAAPASQMFSYFAKAGTAVGATLPDFDDCSWRLLNRPEHVVGTGRTPALT